MYLDALFVACIDVIDTSVSKASTSGISRKNAVASLFGGKDT
jgi:hypothetical protein